MPFSTSTPQTLQREILYFLLYYIYMTVLVTLLIKVFAHKTYEEIIKYDVFL